MCYGFEGLCPLQGNPEPVQWKSQLSIDPLAPYVCRKTGCCARRNEPRGKGWPAPVAPVAGKEGCAMQQRLVFFLIAGVVLVILNALGVIAGVVVFPLS